MKILDRYILSRFLYNFISSFVILMLIFIFQAIWFFIDELAGKGLDIVIVSKFLFYYSPNLIPNVLPLTILLASIMTFGNFAENYEFAAMKASGISLQRAMKSLIVFIVLLGVGTFFFANNVIPQAEYKSYNLRRNIAKLKPALVITEGIFNDIGELNLKVKDKYGENDNFLKDVIIHQKNPKGENSVVIKAKDGELVSSEDSNVIQLILKDGNYYEDLNQKDKRRQNYPHAKAYFETYTMNIDLSELNDVDLSQESVSSTYKMLNIKELRYTADSLEKDYTKIVSNFGNSIYNRSANLVSPDNDNIKKLDDSIIASYGITPDHNVFDVVNEKRKLDIIKVALGHTRTTKNTVEGKKHELKRRVKLINLHKILLNDKIALALTCIVLFFIGAPLGAIIRKGGLGLPIVIAIGLFITYYFIGIFAKNMAEDNTLNPHLSPWIPVLILFPLSILLTKNATQDKGLKFSFFNKILSLFEKLTALTEESQEINLNALEVDKTSNEYLNLEALTDEKLIEIAKNYKLYGHKVPYRGTSLFILKERGVNINELYDSGALTNQLYNKAETKINKYKENCLRAFILYVASVILSTFMTSYPDKTLVVIAIVISTFLYILYFYYIYQSGRNISSFYKLLNKKEEYSNTFMIFLSIGLPFVYFYYRNKLEEDIKLLK